MWLAHQANEFFGRSVVVASVDEKGRAHLKDEPRWWEVVDIEEAMDAVADVLHAWWQLQAWPGMPPFSGGVLDAWPQRLSDGLSEARREWAAILEFRHWREKQEVKRG